MKICYVTLGFMPAIKLGGPVQNAYHLTTNLKRRGHEITVVCTNLASKNERLFPNTTRSNSEGVEVIYFDVQKLFPLGMHSFGLFLSLGMYKFCKEELKSYDVVHIDGYRDFPSLIASYYCRQYGVPYILQPRGSIPIVGSIAVKRIFDLLLGRRMLDACALIIASSLQEESGFSGIVPQDQTVVRISNGIDLKQFADMPPKGEFRRRHDIKRPYLIAYVGRIHAQKGIDVLIRATAITTNRSDIHLAIIGPDEGCQARLCALATDLGLRDSVTFVDALAGREKLEAYVDSDSVVYVTSSESFGMVPIEAVMCGVPAITAEGSPCGDFLKALGVNFSVPYGDSQKLAVAIDNILANKTEASRKVDIAAEAIARMLSWESISRKYETAYCAAVNLSNFGKANRGRGFENS
jgi:glycosyltransferase involved in cell wall biosynthesis